MFSVVVHEQHGFGLIVVICTTPAGNADDGSTSWLKVVLHACSDGSNSTFLTI